MLLTWRAAARKALSKSVRAEILAYPHWRAVLAALALAPLTLDLPSTVELNDTADQDWSGGAESVHHKRLKEYLAERHELLDLKGGYSSSFEVCLPSADRADLFLINETDLRIVCVEVKSRVSNDSDLLRGIFQCIKYRAILDAHQRYELLRSPTHTENNVRVLLVTECPLSTPLTRVAKFLGVEVKSIQVPEAYKPKTP